MGSGRRALPPSSSQPAAPRCLSWTTSLWMVFSIVPSTPSHSPFLTPCYVSRLPRHLQPESPRCATSNRSDSGGSANRSEQAATITQAGLLRRRLPPTALTASANVPGRPATTKPEKTSIYSGRAKCSHFCWFRPPARHKSSRHSGGRGSAKFGSAGYRWPTVRRMSPADAMKGIGQGFPGVGQHLSNPIEYHRSDRPFASVATGC